MARPLTKRTSTGEVYTRPPSIEANIDGAVADGEGVLRRRLTLLAGKAVGAPFVGAVAATLAVSEVLRLLHGGPVHQMIDLDLQCVEHRSVAVRDGSFGNPNPGYQAAA